MTNRPLVSIVVLDKDGESIEPIVKSITDTLSKESKVRTECVIVVFDRNFSLDNQRQLLSLKRFMKIRTVDWNPKCPEGDLACFSRGYSLIAKKPSDSITEEEVQEKIKEVLISKGVIKDESI